MRSLFPSAVLLAGAVLVISGCQDPISPESSEGPLLHTGRRGPQPFHAVMDSRFPIANFECLTFLADGTIVFEGCVLPQTLTGDLEGGGASKFDGIIDAAGNGPVSGTVLYTACVAPGVCGDFEGSFGGEFTAGIFTGAFRLRGMTGGVKKIKIKATFIAPEADRLYAVGTRLLSLSIYSASPLASEASILRSSRPTQKRGPRAGSRSTRPSRCPRKSRRGSFGAHPNRPYPGAYALPSSSRARPRRAPRARVVGRGRACRRHATGPRAPASGSFFARGARRSNPRCCVSDC